MLRLRKLDEDYDPTDQLAAMTYLQERQAAGEIVTGLLYIDDERRRPARPAEHGRHAAQRASARPSSARAPAALAAINAGLR